MSLPAGFTLDGARRIGEATRAYEAGLLGQGGFTSRAPGGPGLMLAKTPSSLPGGYTGSTALQGTLVELPQGSSTYHTVISKVWIQALNDEALTASTTYHARFAGTLTQSGTTLPYFLVDAGATGLASDYIGETCIGYYAGGATNNTYTEVRVDTGPLGYETWRLMHGSGPDGAGTQYGVWRAFATPNPTSAYDTEIPTFGVSTSGRSTKFTFKGKRGAYVSGSGAYGKVYECSYFTVDTIMGFCVLERSAATNWHITWRYDNGRSVGSGEGKRYYFYRDGFASQYWQTNPWHSGTSGESSISIGDFDRFQGFRVYSNIPSVPNFSEDLVAAQAYARTNNQGRAFAVHAMFVYTQSHGFQICSWMQPPPVAGWLNQGNIVPFF